MVIDKNFSKEVEERSGQNLKVCYQCLKCFVGCPVATHMDFKPNNIIRMIQYGMREKILKSHSIWLCLSCMTCGVRCPNEIDMSEVYDTLREMSLEAGYQMKAESKIVKVHQEFVRSVKFWGRLHEITFFVAYFARSLDVIANMPAGITLLVKRKLPFIPKKIEGIEEINQLFEKAYKTKGQITGKE